MRRTARSTAQLSLAIASVAAAASCVVLGWSVRPVETMAFTVAALAVVGLRLLQARQLRSGGTLMGRYGAPLAPRQELILVPIKASPRRAAPSAADRRRG